MTTGKRTLLVLVGALLLDSCTSFDTPRTPSMALDQAAVSTTYLGAWTQREARQHPGLSGLRLLDNGAEAFALRTSLAAHAQKSLDVQTYILGDDQSSKALQRKMLQAAQRGVRTRLLLDDTASLGKQRMLAALDSHPNVDVRVFNPVTAGRRTWLTYHLALVADFARKHRRMHNKLWLADGAVAITGGRNLGDEYFEIADEINFDDLDVMAIGPVVNALSGSFDAYWNHSLAVPLRRFERAPPTAWRALLAEFNADARQGHSLPPAASAGQFVGESGQALRASLVWASAIALWDHPGKFLIEGYPALELTLLGQLGDAFQALQERLLIVSPYVVPTQDGIQYQQVLASRGVELTIITNALEATDLPSLHGAYVPWRPALLANGAHIFEMRAQPATPRGVDPASEISSLHTKAMAFDDEQIFIGSMNADPRAVWWNSEVGLLIESHELARQLWTLAEQAMHPSRSYEVGLTNEGQVIWQAEKEGHRVRLGEEPGSPGKKLKAWAIRLLNIEHLL